MEKSETVARTCDNCAFYNIAFYEPPCSLCCKPDNKWTPVKDTENKTVEELEEICADNHCQKGGKMEIRINTDGYLRLFRKNTWKLQLCPYAAHPDVEVDCGDWCPAFREPEVCDDTSVRLQLCQVTLVTKPDNFEDLR